MAKQKGDRWILPHRPGKICVCGHHKKMHSKATGCMALDGRSHHWSTREKHRCQCMEFEKVEPVWSGLY